MTDTAMGIAADKIAAFAGRLGVFVGVVTAISCAAFVALPFAAGTGPGAQAWFIGLILIWVVTSSALRCSIGIWRMPSSILKSMVGDGSAT